MSKVSHHTPKAQPKPPREVYNDGKVIISSDLKLTPHQAKRLAREVEAAWRRDAFEQGRNPNSLKHDPIEIGVLSDRGYARYGGDKGSDAVAVDGIGVLFRGNFVAGGLDAGDRFLIGHEVSHVQDQRLGGTRGYNRFPTFLEEGKANVLGNLFDASRNVDNSRNQHLTARDLGRYSAKDAQAVFNEFRDPTARPTHSATAERRNYQLGTLYVEFLRTRLGGSGTPDALGKLDEIVKGLKAKGATFDELFAKQFGVAPREAEAQFVAFLRATEGHPADRLRGTIYEGK